MDRRGKHAMPIQDGEDDSKVPAFLKKLQDMLDGADAETAKLIHWNEAGNSFLVPDHETFSKKVLPAYFKHQNFSSFVRQLNMYGFHKVPHLQQGSLQSPTSQELWEFQNANFLRGKPELMINIQRKKAQGGSSTVNPPQSQQQYIQPIASSSTMSHFNSQGLLEAPPSAYAPKSILPGPSSSGASEPTPNGNNQLIDLQTIISGITSIRSQQSQLTSELQKIQTSNKHLWTEVISSRERHKRYEDTLDRIMRFLAGVMGHSNAAELFGSLSGGNGGSEAGGGSGGEKGEKKGKGKKGKGKGKKKSGLTPLPQGRLMIGDGTEQISSDEEDDDEGSDDRRLEELEDIPTHDRFAFLPSESPTSQALASYRPPTSNSSRFSSASTPSDALHSNAVFSPIPPTPTVEAEPSTNDSANAASKHPGMQLMHRSYSGNSASGSDKNNSINNNPFSSSLNGINNSNGFPMSPASFQTFSNSLLADNPYLDTSSGSNELINYLPNTSYPTDTVDAIPPHIEAGLSSVQSNIDSLLQNLSGLDDEAKAQLFSALSNSTPGSSGEMVDGATAGGEEYDFNSFLTGLAGGDADTIGGGAGISSGEFIDDLNHHENNNNGIIKTEDDTSAPTTTSFSDLPEMLAVDSSSGGVTNDQIDPDLHSDLRSPEFEQLLEELPAPRLNPEAPVLRATKRKSDSFGDAINGNAVKRGRS